MQHVLLVGGSFFNKTPDAIEFLYRHLIAAMRDQDVTFTPVVFTGRTLNAYVESLARHIDPNGPKVTIVCYSMGAQVVRLFAEQSPEVMRDCVSKVVEYEAIPAGGFSWKTFWKAFTRVPAAFLLSFLGIGIRLSPREVQKFFSSRLHTIPIEEARVIARAAHPQPLWPALRTAFPPLVRRCHELRTIARSTQCIRVEADGSFITEGSASIKPHLIIKRQGHGAPFDPTNSGRVAALVR